MLLNPGCPIQQIFNREVPQTYSESATSFSRDEKLEIYKYAIEHTGHTEELEITLP